MGRNHGASQRIWQLCYLPGPCIGCCPHGLGTLHSHRPQRCSRGEAGRGVGPSPLILQTGTLKGAAASDSQEGLGLRRSRGLVLHFCISSCRCWWLPVQRWASRSTGSPSRGPWPLAFLQQTAFGWVTGTAGHGSCLSLGSDSFLWGPMLSRVAPSP